MKKTLSLLITFLVVLGTAQAQIVYFDAGDVVIPGNFDGLYVDIETGQTGLSETAVPGWDVNFIMGGGGILTNTNFQAVSANATDPLAANLNVGSGSLVSSALTFSQANTQTASFTHTGIGSNQFEAGVEGFLGFQFESSTGATNYGWMRVTFLDETTTGILHDWAYDSTGAWIEVGGVIPEPSTYAMLLGMSALLLVWVRRRYFSDEKEKSSNGRRL